MSWSCCRPPSGSYNRHRQAVPFKGHGEWRVVNRSAEGRRNLAPTSDGGDWCPMHGIGGNRCGGDMERASLKASMPAEGGGRVEDCSWRDSAAASLPGLHLYLKGIEEDMEDQWASAGPTPMARDLKMLPPFRSVGPCLNTWLMYPGRVEGRLRTDSEELTGKGVDPRITLLPSWNSKGRPRRQQT